MTQGCALPDSVRAELSKLGDMLDRLLDMALVANGDEGRERCEYLIRELMWDNKVAIIRALQAQRHANGELTNGSKE